MTTRVRVVAALLSLIVVAFGLTFLPPGPSASAAEPTAAIPLDNLPGCDDPAERGGWILRSFLAIGTDNPDALEVRPRSTRLGEPCLDGGALAIPATLTELPMVEPEGGYPGGSGSESPVGTVASFAGYGPYVSNEIQYLGLGTMFGSTQRQCWVALNPDQDAPFKVRYDDYDTGSEILPSYYASESLANMRYQRTYFGYSGGCDAYPSANMVSTRGTAGTAPSAYWFGTSNNPLDAWGMTGEVAGAAPGDINGVSASLTIIGNNPYNDDDPSFITCSNSRTGTAPFNVELGGVNGATFFSDGTNPPALNLHDGAGASQTALLKLDPDWTVEACPFLVSLQLSVSTWQGIGISAWSTFSAIWVYDIYTRGPIYGDGNDDEFICENTADVLYGDCDPILYPPFQNWGDFDTVCADPPVLAWGSDSASLAEIVAFYATCLFVPQGGWDWQGDLESARSQSAVGQITGSIEEVATSASFAADCGVILDATGTEVPLTINTCEWSAWTGPSHGLIVAATSIFFMFWAARFLLGTVSGVINRTTPNPLGDDK